MLKNKLKNHKIILASASPRRHLFFKEMDLDFEVRLKDIEEIYPDHLRREEITNYLSELKASAFTIEPNEILITSDTIVWQNNRAMGKPKDETEAMSMLQTLSGKVHEVITSVCFKTTDRITTIYDTTKVTFASLSDEQILYYIKTHNPLDKAGAYGIQDWIGLVGVAKIEGSYTNVMGLPTTKVFDYLNSYEDRALK